MISVPDVFLSSTGKKIDVKFYENAYRTTLEGVDFCGENPGGLINAIRLFHSVQTTDPSIKPTRTQLLCNILSNSGLLEDRQKALIELDILSTSDIFAKEAVEKIKRQKQSLAAKWLVLTLNKQDFSYVTSVEIHENVQDINDRNMLLDELGKRVRLR